MVDRCALFRFASARAHDPAIDQCLATAAPELALLAGPWISHLRALGPDLRELMHDGHPTFCAGEFAFAYVGIYRAHVSLGFYRGVELDDPDRLLGASGRLMRHVKLWPGKAVNEPALHQLVECARAEIVLRALSGSA